MTGFVCLDILLGRVVQLSKVDSIMQQFKGKEEQIVKMIEDTLAKGAGAGRGTGVNTLHERQLAALLNSQFPSQSQHPHYLPV